MRLWEFRSFVQLCWGSDVVGDTAVVEQTCTLIVMRRRQVSVACLGILAGAVYSAVCSAWA